MLEDDQSNFSKKLLEIPLKFYKLLNSGNFTLFRSLINKSVAEDVILRIRNATEEKIAYGLDSYYQSCIEVFEFIPDLLIITKNVRLTQADIGW